MTINQGQFNGARRRIGALYHSHAKGRLSASEFTTRARTELHATYMQHTQGLIAATTSRFMAELTSFQTQFGFDLVCTSSLTSVTRGYRGLRASMYIRDQAGTYPGGSIEIYIGPFDHWDRVAVHTRAEAEAGGPSFYTKRRAHRWEPVESFNYPDLLERIKEDANRRKRADEDEEIPF